MAKFEQCLAKDICARRIKQRGVLVVYGPDHRYREICSGMA